VLLAVDDARCSGQTLFPPSNIRIMILVHLNFCQSFDAPPPQPTTNLFRSQFPSPVTAHNVEITKRVNEIHSDRSMGTHTARRARHNPPIRRASTQK